MRVLIYGRDTCKFCNKAKKLAEFCKSVPQIFADGRYIGGYTEFDLWLRNKVARGRIEFNAYIGGG